MTLLFSFLVFISQEKWLKTMTRVPAPHLYWRAWSCHGDIPVKPWNSWQSPWSNWRCRNSPGISSSGGYHRNSNKQKMKIEFCSSKTGSKKPNQPTTNDKPPPQKPQTKLKSRGRNSFLCVKKFEKMFFKCSFRHVLHSRNWSCQPGTHWTQLQFYSSLESAVFFVRIPL